MGDDHITDRLVRNIRNICKVKGISIMQMETDLGFSAGLISRWNNAKTSPSFDKIVAIMEYLDIGYDELMKDFKSANTKEFAGTHSDKEMLARMEKASANGTLSWMDVRGEEPFDFPMDELFLDWQKYHMHRVYYAPYDIGWFLYAVQYNEDDEAVDVEVYMLGGIGMPLDLVDASGHAVRLLRYIDENLYYKIAGKRTERMKVRFMKEAV